MHDHQDIVCIVPARMNATRFPGKPLCLLGGVPMVVRAAQRAKEAKLGRVVIAAAEREICQQAQHYGIESILTNPNLQSGTDRVAAALKALDALDALGDKEPTKNTPSLNSKPSARIIVNVQGDMPLIEPAIIRQTAQALVLALTQSLHYDIATPITKWTPKAPPNEPNHPDSSHNPNRVKCASAPPHNTKPTQALYFSRNPIPANANFLWEHIGLYAFTEGALQRFVSLPPSGLEQTEKLEQLRALENGMRILAVPVKPKEKINLHAVDTKADADLINAFLAQQTNNQTKP